MKRLANLTILLLGLVYFCAILKDNLNSPDDLGIRPKGAQLFGAPDPNNFAFVDTEDTRYIVSDIMKLIKPNTDKTSTTSGIVILGYDNVIYEVLALISYLKEYSKLEIEFFYADDISPKYMDILKTLDIKIINLASSPLYQKKVSEDRKYYLKPLAMLSTSFENVVYLDSDCFPLLHKEDVFTKSFEYLKSTDALFFRDYWMMTPENPIYQYLGISYTLQRQVDSSVIVYRKSRSMEMLLLSYYICLEKHFDYYLFGDKDSYWFSAMLLRLYKPEIKPPRILLNPEMSGFVGTLRCGVGMLHLLNGDPAFVHLNGFKSRLSKGLPNKKPLFCERTSVYSVIQESTVGFMTIGKSDDGDMMDDGSQSYSLYDDQGQCVASQSDGIVTEMDNSVILEKYEKSFKRLRETCDFNK